MTEYNILPTIPPAHRGVVIAHCESDALGGCPAPRDRFAAQPLTFRTLRAADTVNFVASLAAGLRPDYRDAACARVARRIAADPRGGGLPKRRRPPNVEQSRAVSVGSGGRRERRAGGEVGASAGTRIRPF